MMQYVKGSLPDSIITVEDLLRYLVNKIKYELTRRNECSIVVACFDTDTVPVKKIVEYGKRKEWRCKHCKVLPYDKDTKKYEFSPECKSECKFKVPLLPEDGPHLPESPSDRLPCLAKYWMRFAANSTNLRRELYPRLMNVFLEQNWAMPDNGQTIIISGLPCDSEVVSADHIKWQFGFTPSKDAERRLLKPFRIGGLSSYKWTTKMYQQVYRFQNINHQIYRHLVPEMEHQIAEADNSCFFFLQFYPNANAMIVINDGDAITIGLWRVVEDFINGKCNLKRYVALPRRKSTKPGEYNYSHDYLDLVKFKQLIETNPLYTQYKVANPVATVGFLVILAGTDFFQDFCQGIGYKTKYNDDEAKRAKQTEGIWDTFHSKLSLFTHLVQWNVFTMIPDCTVKRRIVLDEELFALFVYHCYLNKYGRTVMKKVKASKLEDVKLAEIKAHCAKMKRVQNRLPDKQKIQLWARQITWNMDYWVNACRNIPVDPFKHIDNKPYYGYVKKGSTMVLASAVHPVQEDVGDAYMQHFLKTKREQRQLKPKLDALEIVKRKKNAIDMIRGKI